MFAITGITGQVGGAVAHSLLERGRSIRAVVRDPGRAQAWTARGAELAVADIGNPSALANALTGVEGAFILVPPLFDPAPGFPEAQALAARLSTALDRDRRRASSICPPSAPRPRSPICSPSTR